MKKTGQKTLLFALLLLALFCMVCVFASATDVTVTLDVLDGDDLSEAFNRATDRARYFGDGDHLTVIVPAGDYDSSANLRIYSHTTVSMTDATITHTSEDSTMLRLGRLSADWVEANGGEGHPGYSGFTDITIEGGTFDGGGFKQAILRLGHSSDITLRGVTFRNVKNTHMVEIGGCKDVLIEGCTFADFRGDRTTNTNYEALQFEIVSEQGNHFGGYNPNNDETPCENITVTGCTFKNLQRGVGTHSGIAGSYFSNIAITNNSFSNITGFGIIATNYTDSQISDNKMSKCGAGIIFRTMELSHNNIYASEQSEADLSAYPLLNSEICRNRISVTPKGENPFTTFSYGIQLTGELLKKGAGTAPAGDFRVAGVLVSENVIRLNCDGYGIWLNGGAENRVADNQITVTLRGEVATNGIRMQKCEDCRLVGNKIKIKNKSSFADVTGISVLEHSTDNLVYGSGISGQYRDGVFLLKSDDNVIRSNKISAPKRDGIHLEDADGVTVMLNTVKKPGHRSVSAANVTGATYHKNKTVNQ